MHHRRPCSLDVAVGTRIVLEMVLQQSRMRLNEKEHQVEHHEQRHRFGEPLASTSDELACQQTGLRDQRPKRSRDLAVDVSEFLQRGMRNGAKRMIAMTRLQLTAVRAEALDGGGSAGWAGGH